jgi:hypothetical protein
MARTTTELSQPPLSINAQHAEMTQTTSEMLARQPKRTVRIPVRDDVKQRFVMVWVNGHSFQIMRGVDVDVPESVYNILVESAYI